MGCLSNTFTYAVQFYPLWTFCVHNILPTPPKNLLLLRSHCLIPRLTVKLHRVSQPWHNQHFGLDNSLLWESVLCIAGHHPPIMTTKLVSRHCQIARGGEERHIVSSWKPLSCNNQDCEVLANDRHKDQWNRIESRNTTIHIRSISFQQRLNGNSKEKEYSFQQLDNHMQKKKNYLDAHIGDIVDSVPDHYNKVNISIKRVRWILGFPSAYKSYVFTTLY